LTSAIRPRALVIAGAFAAGLVLAGLLRAAGTGAGPAMLASLAGLATPLYILLTIAAALGLARCGAPLRRFGFGPPFRPGFHVALAVGAIIVLRLAAIGLEPLLEAVFGAGRDLERFGDLEGSKAAMVRLLAFSWTFAAFGEEIAFRIVLMGGLAHGLGGSRGARVAALLLQAIVFGLVHLYQGPAGVAGATVNGLFFGAVVLVARGSIWPAALAHGGSNTLSILELYAGGR
jgi:membrane protease YdiL (CAAX protease family)